jgi:tetratricopeptide (TPR) repeat protein
LKTLQQLVNLEPGQAAAWFNLGFLSEELGQLEQAVAAFERALVRLELDTSLARADRMGALYARVMLARLAFEKDAVQVQLAPTLVAAVRDGVARADRETTNGYERQAVITFAAAVLARAGLWDDSEALLKRNLERSHSPYYLMSQLAGNYRRLGRTADALSWYERSFTEAVGPATRLQWGSGYVSALIDLAPKEAARIEKAVSALFAEAGQDSAAFEGRSARSLKRVADKLASWNADGSQAAVVARLERQLAGVCAKLGAADGQRDSCRALLKAGGAGKAVGQGHRSGLTGGEPCRRMRASSRQALTSAASSGGRCTATGGAVAVANHIPKRTRATPPPTRKARIANTFCARPRWSGLSGVVTYSPAHEMAAEMSAAPTTTPATAETLPSVSRSATWAPMAAPLATAPPMRTKAHGRPGSRGATTGAARAACAASRAWADAASSRARSSRACVDASATWSRSARAASRAARQARPAAFMALCSERRRSRAAASRAAASMGQDEGAAWAAPTTTAKARAARVIPQTTG